MDRILMIKTHALGDVLMTTPVIRAVKKAYPHCRIYYLTGKWSEPALRGNPYLEKIFSLEDDIIFKGKIHRILPLVFKLKSYNFNGVLVFSQSIFLHGIAKVICSGVRVGFAGKIKTITHAPAIKVLQEEYAPKAFCSLLKYIGVENDGYHLDFKPQPVKMPESMRLFFQRFERIVGFFCGGGKNPKDSVVFKQWPKEYFIDLGKKLFREHCCGILLFGSGHETEINQQIAKGMGDICLDISGMFDFSKTANIISMCDLFITNDSAPFHLAYTVETETIGLFGPSDHRLLAPEMENCHVIKSPRDCCPCYGNSIFIKCDAPDCMGEISVDRVYRVAEDVILK